MATSYGDLCDLPRAQCLHGLEGRKQKKVKKRRKAAGKTKPSAEKKAVGKSGFPARPEKCTRCGQKVPQGRYWMCGSCLLKPRALGACGARSPSNRERDTRRRSRDARHAERGARGPCGPSRPLVRPPWARGRSHPTCLPTAAARWLPSTPRSHALSPLRCLQATAAQGSLHRRVPPSGP